MACNYFSVGAACRGGAGLLFDDLILPVIGKTRPQQNTPKA